MINIADIGKSSTIQQMNCRIGDKFNENNFENIFVFEFKMISL